MLDKGHKKSKTNAEERMAFQPVKAGYMKLFSLNKFVMVLFDLYCHINKHDIIYKIRFFYLSKNLVVKYYICVCVYIYIDRDRDIEYI